MISVVLIILGRFLAALPVCLVECIGAFFGGIIYYGFSSRRYIILSNLHHAFPKKPGAWHRRIARESCRRMVEMALFSLASPYFSETRIRKMFKADKSLGEGNSSIYEHGKPAIIVTPHFSLMESLTLTTAIDPKAPKDIENGAFYRPLGNPALDRRVKKARERFGMRLLSRKAGFGQAMKILKNNGRVAVLFDQNAGAAGTLTLFFGRLASTSELAGLLAEKFKAPTLAVYTEHTGFWRGTLRSERICDATDAASATIAAGIWLEKKLRQDDNHCADWLWAHKRWKTQDGDWQRLRIEHKRNLLPATLAALNTSAYPRTTRFLLRMPEDFSQARSAIPLIRAIRKGRPDAEITIAAKKEFTELALSLGLAEKTVTLPESAPARLHIFRRLRNEYPDTCIVLSDTFAGDLDAFLTKAPQRFGMCRKKQSRRLLTHCRQIPDSAGEGLGSLSKQWQGAFGLKEPLEFPE